MTETHWDTLCWVIVCVLILPEKMKNTSRRFTNSITWSWSKKTTWQRGQSSRTRSNLSSQKIHFTLRCFLFPVSWAQTFDWWTNYMVAKQHRSCPLSVVFGHSKTRAGPKSHFLIYCGCNQQHSNSGRCFSLTGSMCSESRWGVASCDLMPVWSVPAELAGLTTTFLNTCGIKMCYFIRLQSDHTWKYQYPNMSPHVSLLWVWLLSSSIPQCPLASCWRVVSRFLCGIKRRLVEINK